MNRPTVTLSQGRVRGFWRGGSAAFLGVPFADAPIGDLRFAAARSASGWNGVWDGSQFGATPQRRPFGQVTGIPEPSYPGDATLNVNVFTPAPGDAAARLPVLVWIHGGGFKAGSPNSPWYDGLAFNRDGIVTVSVSYRLGLEGFGHIADCPDNRGLRDQVAALEWVRDNIAGFGGDPDNVTIGGQSAGGFSVLALMASPLAQGLFHAAIAESSPLRERPLDEARDMTDRFARLAGVPATAAGLATLREGTVLDLVGELEAELNAPAGSPQALVDGFLRGEAMGLAFVPVVGDEVLPLPIIEAFDAGLGAVPLLIGTTRHEFDTMGYSLAELIDGTDVESLLRRSAVAEFAPVLCAEMAGFPPGVVAAHLNTIMSFRLPSVRVGAHHAGPTWLYDFAFRGLRADGSRGISAHCGELPFVFDCLDVEPSYVAAADGIRPPAELAQRMHGDWVRFVSTHEAAWTPWRPGGEAMVYDEDCAVKPGYLVEQQLASILGQ